VTAALNEAPSGDCGWVEKGYNEQHSPTAPPLVVRGSGPPSNTTFLGSPGASDPNRTSIRAAVCARRRHTTDRQTNRLKHHATGSSVATVHISHTQSSLIIIKQECLQLDCQVQVFSLEWPAHHWVVTQLLCIYLDLCRQQIITSQSTSSLSTSPSVPNDSHRTESSLNHRA